MHYNNREDICLMLIKNGEMSLELSKNFRLLPFVEIFMEFELEMKPLAEGRSAVSSLSLFRSVR